MQNRLPELASTHASALNADIVMEPTLDGAAPELMARIGFEGKSLLIVCDANTYEAMGKKLFEALQPAKPELLILAGTPEPNDAAVSQLTERNPDAIIGVGGGTISDICKYASYLQRKPYAMFPTAPSMNGYLSANASIIQGRHKKTLPAHLPQAVFCDMAVIASAPKRLILSGLGDSLCRPTAQADWLLSHLLLDTPYNSAPFDLLTPYEDLLFAQSDKLVTGDPEVILLLMKTLLVSGIGMVLAGGSYPASQGEHLIAHTMEMRHHDALPPTYHGEQIGVTTLTMARLQEEALSNKLSLHKREPWGKNITAYFGATLAQSVMEASHPKYLLRERYDEINARLDSRGKEIRAAILAVTKPEATLREVLTRAGAPATPADLGWSERDYDLAVFHARFIRDRFTFLDLL